MNYMMQMNNFWTKRRVSRINSNAADLYYALLDVSNSVGWSNNLPDSNTMLAAMTEMSDSALIRARQALIDEGFIRYHYGGGPKSGTYEIIEFKYEELYK